MRHYDPAKAPDPKEWLSLDEMERQSLVEDYHRRARIRPPNEEAHALFHAIVENQIAAGDDEVPARRTADRLMAEGLDRHEAIHAIASVLAEHLYELKKGNVPADPDASYFAALDRLTAEAWLSSADEDEELIPDETGRAGADGSPAGSVPTADMLDRPNTSRPLAAEALRAASADDGPAVNPFKSVGRNEPCPCGSGKKYKKCCLA